MERFELQLPANVSSADSEAVEALELITSDVCAGGAFIETDRPLPLEAEVKVNLVFPLDRLRKIKANKVEIDLKGAVIRATDQGMAVCFGPGYTMSQLGDRGWRD